MKFPIIEKIAGTTFKPTFNGGPGVTASPITSVLIDRNETLVNSVAATSSGDGRYYALHMLPNTPGWYTNKWYAVIGVNTYVAAQFVRARLPEVD